MAGGLIGAAIAAARAHAAELAEAAATAAAAGAAVAANSGPGCPPRTAWAFFIRAWRPFCGWMIGLLLARSVAVPIVQLARGDAVETTDWTALAAMAGVLFITRSFERAKGIA